MFEGSDENHGFAQLVALDRLVPEIVQFSAYFHCANGGTAQSFLVQQH